MSTPRVYLTGWEVNTEFENLVTNTDYVCNTSNQFSEYRIPLSNFGNISVPEMHLSIVDESSGNNWTYAAVPSTSFIDGINPDYTRYYSFDFYSEKAPNANVPTE